MSSTARVWDEPVSDEDLDELAESSAYRPEPDTITEALGATWHAADYVLDDCVERYAGSALTGHPQRFDRYYLHTPLGPLLIDVLIGDGDQAAAQARRKHVAFKQRWCAENDRAYLVLEESDVSVPRIRAILAAMVQKRSDGEGQPAPATPAKAKPATAKRARGTIQRPKAE